MWIKICGMTTSDAVAAAIDAGADAIGFVFAQSVRRVSPEVASGLAAPARGRVRCVAVTKHPSQQDIDEILKGLKPDVLQTDAVDIERLRLPRELELLPVLRAEPAAGAELSPRLLFEGTVSGAGVTCDWSAARRVARRAQVVLAGGLNARNVAAAIAEVVPFGVDVSSGVESRPGVKSPVEIASFVLAARRASPGAATPAGTVASAGSATSAGTAASAGAATSAGAAASADGRASSESTNSAASHSGEVAQQSRGGRVGPSAHEESL